MDLNQIRTDLADRLETVDGLTAYADTPGSPVVPCAILHPALINSQPCLDNTSADIDINVQILVQIADLVDAQITLDTYLSTGGVIDAIQAATSGTESMNVMAIDGYGTIDFAVDGGAKTYAVVTLHVNILV